MWTISRPQMIQAHGSYVGVLRVEQRERGERERDGRRAARRRGRRVAASRARDAGVSRSRSVREPVREEPSSAVEVAMRQAAAVAVLVRLGLAPRARAARMRESPP